MSRSVGSGDDTSDGSSRWVRLGAVAGVLCVVAVVTALVGLVSERLLAEAPLRASLERAGPAAPVLFVFLQALQVVVAPVPGQLLAGVGGYVFGGLLGALYSMAGVCLGSSLVFALARRYGESLVARVLDERTRTRFERFGAENGVLTLFVFFLLPTFPDDALCVLAGLWRIRPRTFLAVLVVGRTPTFLAAAYAGRSLETGALGRFGLLLTALGVVVVAVYAGRDWIERRLEPGDG
jgi:uncharacterized membrane protein YdjX (TVP38/TMEM64 family)